MVSNEERVREYVNAVTEGDWELDPASAIARRVMAVADAEQSELRAERSARIGDDSIRSTELKDATRRAEAAEAKVAELREALTAAASHVKTFCHEAFVRGERADAAEAKVARVEALADQWERTAGWVQKAGLPTFSPAAVLRAALDGDA